MTANILIEENIIAIDGWMEAELFGELLLVFQEKGFNQVQACTEGIRLVRFPRVMQSPARQYDSMTASQHDSNQEDE